MKKMIYFILLFSATYGYSQTEDDYTAAIDAVVGYYNAEDTDGLHNMYSAELKTTISYDVLKGMMVQDMKNRGVITGRDFLMDDEAGKSFLIHFADSDLLLTILLGPDKKITTFILTEY